MYKNSILLKKIIITITFFTLTMISTIMYPVNAYPIDKSVNFNNAEMINNIVVNPAAVGGFNQYFTDCPYQENSLIVTQFSGSKLFLSAAATPGYLGHADYVTIRIKQKDGLGFMQTIYSGTVYTNGVAKMIVNGNSITPYADLQITADVRSYNGTICTANVSISASSSN